MNLSKIRKNQIKKLDDIKKSLIKENNVLYKIYGLKIIGIFGSYIRGEENKDSDIDILVEIEEPISLLKFIEIENYLSKKLGIKVDLVIKDTLKRRIGKHILNELIKI